MYRSTVTIKMELQEKILQAMQERGISHYKLCKELQIPESSFSCYIRFDRAIRHTYLTRILEYLNLLT